LAYEGMLAESVLISGDGGDYIEAYYARPLGPGPFPGVAVIHHMPGWDEWTKEVVRRFAHHGYAAISPHLYHRWGPGAPDDLAARARSDGGMVDSQVMGDVAGSMQFLRNQPNANGKIGLIGFCSGGRHVVLACGQLDGIDAAVDCWGGGVIPNERSGITPQRPVAPIDLTAEISAPLLGIFGNDDTSPSPEDVDKHEAELQKHGKQYEFHRYEGAGHGFFAWERPNYRQEQAVDGWTKVFAFYEKHLRVAAPAEVAVS
jgi:carboxymethylenebutenolidase